MIISIYITWVCFRHENIENIENLVSLQMLLIYGFLPHYSKRITIRKSVSCFTLINFNIMLHCPTMKKNHSFISTAVASRLYRIQYNERLIVWYIFFVWPK